MEGHELDVSDSGQGQVVNSCKRGDEPPGSIKCWHFLNIWGLVSFSGRTLLHGVGVSYTTSVLNKVVVRVSGAAVRAAQYKVLFALNTFWIIQTNKMKLNKRDLLTHVQKSNIARIFVVPPGVSTLKKGRVRVKFSRDSGESEDEMSGFHPYLDVRPN